MRRAEGQKVLEQMMRDMEQQAGTRNNTVYVEEERLAESDVKYFSGKSCREILGPKSARISH